MQHTLKHHFQQLPRELRDIIYAEIYREPAPEPISLNKVQIEPAGLALLAGDKTGLDLEHEILEAFYAHNTFTITFPDPHYNKGTSPVGFSAFPQYEENIRRLVLYTTEDVTFFRKRYNALEDFELQCLLGQNPSRAHWERLLSLTRLEQLTINFQKAHASHFSWADFSPILVHLRETLPKLNISFCVSFDMLLEREWNHPRWANHPNQDDYEPMGFVDVSELVGPPTEQDWKYVGRYEPHDNETYGRTIVGGLLGESASGRRSLALHYVVNSPGLVRVRMVEQYELYKRMRGQTSIQTLV